METQFMPTFDKFEASIITFKVYRNSPTSYQLYLFQTYYRICFARENKYDNLLIGKQ